jgi:hypothetical protein
VHPSAESYFGTHMGGSKLTGKVSALGRRETG